MNFLLYYPLKFFIALSKRHDLALATMLVMIIFMMIIPLPTVLVDVLIALNICIAIMLLMVGIYLLTPLEFPAFPSVLLTTTLFRLALSISTTRLILLQADAGNIVETFGNFVVGGNLIVGLVIFLIITIVQFIVVTKGAERVAEVGARFSLDAMPGKQMSIDGDMRAGAIDMKEASRRRSLVEKESQLYGAMDGAMKFVKGDAIAGLIIIAVNIIGGISIGTLQHGMSAGEALRVYAILTIGDGLVSQIPGLLIAVTAGIIVTRVTGESKQNLGADIVGQIFRNRKAAYVSSVICVGFGLIPGMPTTIFIILACLLTGSIKLTEYLDKRRKIDGKARGVKLDDLVSDSKQTEKEENASGLTMSRPLILEVADDFRKVIEEQNMNKELALVRSALYNDLGVPFPGISLRFSGEVSDQQYMVLLYEIPMASGYLKHGYILAQEKLAHLDDFGVPYEVGDKFLPRLDTVWVKREHIHEMEKRGIAYMDHVQIMTYHLSLILYKHAKDFVGLQETRTLLEFMEKDYGELTKEVQRVLSLQKINDVFKRLVAEDVSIRNMRLILEALIEWGKKEKDVILLVEHIRAALSRQISFRHVNQQNIMSAYLLSTELEDMIRMSIRQTSAGSYLALEPDKIKKILRAIKAAVGDINKCTQMPVLLASMDIRRYLRRLIEKEFPDVHVLSHQEISPDTVVQPMERISI